MSRIRRGMKGRKRKVRVKQNIIEEEATVVHPELPF